MGFFRRLRPAFIVLPGLLSGAACALIFNPRDDVQRCGSASDCEATGDERYVVECVFPEETSLDSTEVDKVCVASFKPLGCDPAAIGGPFEETFEALSVSTRYACEDDAFGSQGCPPRLTDGLCNDGLQRNRFGVCDQGDDAVYMLSGTDAEAGQDILDQFCKGFFCDNRFVCDVESGFVCVICDDDEPFGQGGCGTVNIAGQPSCIYDPETEEDACAGANSDDQEPVFGAC